MDKLRERLVFALNGERHEISDLDPSMTLLEFIRTRTRFRGPKLGCGEGGCGACVVLLSRYDPVTDQVTEFSASSCLLLLGTINHCSVTTTEGLKNTKNGHYYHSIHKRIAGFHASQCGFCTPGMCMSLFSSIVNADKNTERAVPPKGFSKITVSEAEKAISGNLCRCTGYRPLIDACKSFACDVDLEDLGLNTFWKKGDKDKSVVKLPDYSIGEVCTYPDFLKIEIKSSFKLETEENGWYRPNTIEGLYALLGSNSLSARNVKLVVGNTSSGVYKDQDLYDKYIDLRGIPELSVIKKSDDGIEIGSAVTISKVIEVLREYNKGSVVFTKIADHMNQVASPFVRNIASIGGNLILAQRNQFDSDIATILLAVGSTVTIHSGSKIINLALEEFLDKPPTDYNHTLLLSIFIPSWVSYKNVIFETYRASPRPLGNAVSYVNSSFIAQTSLDEKTGEVVLDEVCLAFGAYGTKHAIRAREIEDILKGKKVIPSVILEAMRLLREIILPRDGTTHPEYRVSLAVGFLFKFLSPLGRNLDEQGKIVPIEGTNGTINGHKFRNDVSISSQQEIVLNEEYKPVGEPIKKAGAELQASGEAIYVDDIPAPKDCLYGAFVYSTKPLAHVKGIKFKSSLASKKVINFVSAKDIPKGGKNVGLELMGGSEPLFADSLVEFAGQPLGVVIAETQKYANMAAKQAVVDYSVDNLEQPIITTEDAIKRESYFQIAPMFYPKQVGNFTKGMAEADQTIQSAEVKVASQYYFYMETQTTLAIPDEDNCMTVYTSAQSPEWVQSHIANCLGIPFNNVRVITRRVGGGFGGKVVRNLAVSSACAIAAHKLGRPVRMYLDRKTDMIMIGGRNPIKVYYTVGFKSDGKVTALHLDLRVNAGISQDVSPLLPGVIIEALKKYNWGNLAFDIKVCKTNNTSKSSMRAPGDVQGSFIAEAILEHVASTLSLDTNIVRKKNLHNHNSLKLFFGDQIAGDALTYTLPAIFDTLASTPSYEARVETVKQFNRVNKWRKRGISCVPITYKVNVRPTPGRVSVLNDGSIIVEVGGIEIGQGLYTKVKQMASFGLKELWEGESESEKILEKIRVLQADSFSLIQGGVTGGSTTSESSCEAVRLACSVLVERLKPLKDKIIGEKGVFSWEALIGQAAMQSVNLSASAYWVPELSNNFYLNYGGAISEVEIDLLTGATTILRSDLLYDCGKSLNPAVDLGQVEGGFVQGIGFFLYEEFLTNSYGLAISDSTWNYKIPTVDTIPKEFNVEFLNSPHNKNRVLSSKASGEPPVLLASSVHCAMREAIRAARTEFSSEGSDPLTFQMDVPTTMPMVKELCGLDIVDKYLESLA